MLNSILTLNAVYLQPSIPNRTGVCTILNMLNRSVAVITVTQLRFNGQSTGFRYPIMNLSCLVDWKIRLTFTYCKYTLFVANIYNSLSIQWQANRLVSNFMLSLFIKCFTFCAFCRPFPFLFSSMATKYHSWHLFYFIALEMR